MAKKQFTEKQQAFLDALFGEANGDADVAKRMAGYSETASTNLIVSSVKDEIIERTTNEIARAAPQAAMKFRNVLNDPTQMGAKEAMAAAREVLDRFGVVKVDKVNHTVEAPNGIFVLPAKEPTKTEDDE